MPFPVWTNAPQIIEEANFDLAGKHNQRLASTFVLVSRPATLTCDANHRDANDNGYTESCGSCDVSLETAAMEMAASKPESSRPLA